MTTQIFQIVKSRLREILGAKKLKTVRVRIGDLTFLNPEQLKFAWGVLTEEDEKMKGSTFEIENIFPRGRCRYCGWEGELKTEEDPSYHFVVPMFSCPSCGGEIEITSGLEMTVKEIVVEVEDEGELS